MANLQIKGMDDGIYEELKKLAAKENRSVSQQTLFLVKEYLTKKQHIRSLKPPAQHLLDLFGSWKNDQNSKTIIYQIKKGRKNSKKLKEGF